MAIVPTLKVEKAKTKDLIPYAGNAKEHPEWQVEQIVSSIEQFGMDDPIAVWTNEDGGLEIVEGHGRLLACKKLNIKEVPIIKLDHLDDDARRAYAHVHNQLTMNTGFDIEKLNADIADLTDFEWEDLGFEFPNINNGFEEPIETENDEIPDNAERKVEFGQVWKLGQHILVCGDSTDSSDVQKLMSNEHAELLFTSPPYADIREYNGGKELSTEHLAEFIPIYSDYCEYQAVNLGIKRSKGEIVQYWDDYIHAANKACLKLMAWNVWDKGRCGSVGNQSALVPIRHEFIFVFGTHDKDLNKTWKKTEGAICEAHTRSVRQADGSLSITTTGDTSNPFKEMESVLLVYPVSGKTGDDHPAQFPVNLPFEYIRSFTNEGDIVVDPFGGAGTTLIACEQLGRKARLMELDPHYCDVIIERFERLTGEEAEKIS